MLLGKNYKIESDDLQVTLFERKVRSGKPSRFGRKVKPENIGKEYWIPLGYYSNIRNALRGFINMELLKTGLKDVEIILDKFEELYKLIESVTPETRLETSPTDSSNECSIKEI
jgi:hypothetical protein